MEVAKKSSNLDVFERCVKSGNALEVKKRLKKEFLHSDFNSHTQCQAIHVACKQGFVEVVKILVNKKCNIEQEMIWNIKPVHIVCLVGNIEILKLLILYRCDLESLANIPTDENFDKLFDIDADNSQLISTMKTVQTRPIHIACWKGHLNIVKLMIENDCNLQTNDKDHWKPIHVVCVYGHVEILKLLLENNCTTETEDKYKTKPIHYACKTGHMEIVRILIENNCNFESQNIEKRRPIHYACKSGHVDIVKLLIHNKCNLEAEDIDGKTPLDLALENNNEICVDLILTEIEARKKKISEMRQAFIDTPRPAPPSKERMKVTVKARIESKPEKNICKICYDREVDCVLTCGHVFCMVCGKRFSICPVCRTKSTNHIRLFLD